jgi:uncharacterized damage-inducible protein DinB
MLTMNRDGLLALYQYNAYANHLVLDGLAQLSDDEFTRTPSPSHASIRGLVLHLLECEAWFLALCQGHDMQELSLSTLDDLCRFQAKLEQEQQASTHSTQHRAELGILLGQMGHSLPTQDIIIHFIKESGQSWT